MRIKRLIQLLVLVVVAIISAGFLKTNVSAESVSIQRGNDVYRFYVDTQVGRDLPCREYYTADTKEIVYCIQHSKVGPDGHALNILYNMWPENYAATTRLGLKIILENGYPYKTYGLSAVDARYATQQAIRFYMAYRGIDYTLPDSTKRL